MAGIVSSYAIVPNETIRTRFYDWMTANELNSPNMFAPIVTIAAFRHGEPYRQQLLHYIEQNIEFVIDYCKENIPQIKPVRPEASFLIWLDCRGLKLKQEDLIDLFVNKAHLALNEGSMFGHKGEGFMRFNVGSPRAIIEQAMKQLKEAVDAL